MASVFVLLKISLMHWEGRVTLPISSVPDFGITMLTLLPSPAEFTRISVKAAAINPFLFGTDISLCFFYFATKSQCLTKKLYTVAMTPQGPPSF